MIRSTSLAAYLESNYSPARREVLKVVIRAKQPMTRYEILHSLRAESGRHWEYSSVSGRVNDLICCGALVETGRAKKNPAGSSANLVWLSASVESALSASRMKRAKIKHTTGSKA